MSTEPLSDEAAFSIILLEMKGFDSQIPVPEGGAPFSLDYATKRIHAIDKPTQYTKLKGSGSKLRPSSVTIAG